MKYMEACVTSRKTEKLISVLEAYPDQSVRTELCNELGHTITTCSAEDCCLYFIQYLQKDDEVLTMTAAVRACIGGHTEYVWNVLMSACGHNEYVKGLNRIFNAYDIRECILAAIRVVRGNLSVSEKNTFSMDPRTKRDVHRKINKETNVDITNTGYLDIITLFDETKDMVDKSMRTFVQDLKWVNVEKWHVKENNVSVTLET